MNLNDFIDRSRLGPVRTFKGHTVHVQAAALTRADEAILLLLQGRPTDARAVWAMFHEGDLWDYHRLPGKDTYVKPNPTTRLAQGDLEILVAHVALFAPTVGDWGQEPCYTFGPPHFGQIFQAAMPVPMLPHWEESLWQMGCQMSLVRLLDCRNTQVWQMTVDPERWLRTMATPRWRDHWTYEPQHKEKSLD